MASIVMAYIGMALCSYSHVTLHLKAAMAYIVMAHIVMASMVMASIGMALHSYGHVTFRLEAEPSTTKVQLVSAMPMPMPAPLLS